MSDKVVNLYCCRCEQKIERFLYIADYDLILRELDIKGYSADLCEKCFKELEITIREWAKPYVRQSSIHTRARP